MFSFITLLSNSNSNDDSFNTLKFNSPDGCAIGGYNENEIKLINKTLKNKGFFEKFFDLFN